MLHLGTAPRYILHAPSQSLLWLSTVPNMNKLNLFFLTYCNKHMKFKKNIAIITQTWLRAKWYFTYLSNTWYLITVLNMNKINLFFAEISQQIHNMYEKEVATINQIWHRAKSYFTNIRNAQYLIIVPNQTNCTQYEENAFSLHGEMCKDGQRDGTDPFLYSPILLWRSRE